MHQFETLDKINERVQSLSRQRVYKPGVEEGDGILGRVSEH